MSRLAHSLYQDAGNGEKSDIAGACKPSELTTPESLILMMSRRLVIPMAYVNKHESSAGNRFQTSKYISIRLS